MAQQEQSQEQQTLHPNCTFVCITEDVNNCEMDITTLNSDTTTLDEAKEWISENGSKGHYSCHVLDKIIVIDSNGEIDQIYTRKPEDYGVWKCWY
jgi:hypothetical protein